MKKFWFGLVIAGLGVVAGLWAGVWWAFIGGIVDVISAIRAPELSAMAVAVGVAKVLFSGVIGWVVGAIAVFPGYLMMKSGGGR